LNAIDYTPEFMCYLDKNNILQLLNITLQYKTVQSFKG
jgi:hypothetical protein